MVLNVCYEDLIVNKYLWVPCILQKNTMVALFNVIKIGFLVSLFIYIKEKNNRKVSSCLSHCFLNLKRGLERKRLPMFWLPWINHRM